MAIDFVYSSGSYGREREAMHDVVHECAVEEGFDAEVEVGGGADDGRAEVVVVVAPLLGLGSGLSAILWGAGFLAGIAVVGSVRTMRLTYNILCRLFRGPGPERGTVARRRSGVD